MVSRQQREWVRKSGSFVGTEFQSGGGRGDSCTSVNDLDATELDT